MDFDTRMEQAFIAAYPIPNLAKEKKEQEEAEYKAKVKAEIEAENALKAELIELGVDNPSGTVEELKTKLLSIKSANGDVELVEMKNLLLEFGYDANFCKRLTLEAAKASIEKMKDMQSQIVELGETPASTKNEMEAQLKALKKKE